MIVYHKHVLMIRVLTMVQNKMLQASTNDRCRSWWHRDWIFHLCLHSLWHRVTFFVPEVDQFLMYQGRCEQAHAAHDECELPLLQSEIQSTTKPTNRILHRWIFPILIPQSCSSAANTIKSRLAHTQVLGPSASTHPSIGGYTPSCRAVLCIFLVSCKGQSSKTCWRRHCVLTCSQADDDRSTPPSKNQVNSRRRLPKSS